MLVQVSDKYQLQCTHTHPSSYKRTAFHASLFYYRFHAVMQSSLPDAMTAADIDSNGALTPLRWLIVPMYFHEQREFSHY